MNVLFVQGTLTDPMREPNRLVNSTQGMHTLTRRYILKGHKVEQKVGSTICSMDRLWELQQA